MLFYLDHTIYETYSQRAFSAEEIIFFRDLSIFCQRGECILCGDLESLTVLRDCDKIESRKAYYTACEHFSEHRSIMEAVSLVFVLTFSDQTEKDNLPTFLRQKCRFIPLSKAVMWKQLGGRCTLLGENLKDCEFYELVGKNYCRRNEIHGISIMFHHEAGGGNTTADVLNKQIGKELTPTLCIVDSDKKYGQTSNCTSVPTIGETLRRVRKTEGRLQSAEPAFPFEVYPLPVHEVENLLPQSVLLALTDKLPDIVDGMKTLRKLCDVLGGEPVLYYDLKNGVPCSVTGPRRAYWEEVSSLMPTDDGEPRPDFCFPKVSDNSHLMEWSNQYIESAVGAVDLDGYLLPLWEQLGQKLLSWGCACTPLLV